MIVEKRSFPHTQKQEKKKGLDRPNGTRAKVGDKVP